MVQNFQCPFPIHNILRQRHGRGAVPPEAELRGHSGGHSSTTGAPQTAVRGVLDSPRGGASAMPIGVSGVRGCLEGGRFDFSLRRPLNWTDRQISFQLPR